MIARLPQGVDSLREVFMEQFLIQGPVKWVNREDIYHLYQGKSSVIEFVKKSIDTCRGVFGLRPDQQFSLSQLLDVKAVAIGHLKPGYAWSTLMTNYLPDADGLLAEARRHTRIAQTE